VFVTELESKRVLIAEEDRDLREIIVGFLEAKGWSTIPLANGAGLESVDGALAIAVLDIRSSVSMCCKILEQLRGTQPGLPVVVIASFGDAFVVRRAGELGAACVLEKPFDLEELDRALSKCCGSLQANCVW
jgi:DNA-binding NtrC family response regulator